MKSHDFTTSFVVDRSPEAVFHAVNDVRAWWSGEIDGRTDALGAEFSYRYKKLHQSRQKVTEHVPCKKIVWRVVESRIEFVEDKTEWDGTDIVFEIEPRNGKTELRFTHVGLSPNVECYDACRQGWTFYVQQSLRKLIETGTGEPNE
ncbi:MAG: SRPBCC domain-containing protein [Polyangiaceae bacterium]